MGYTARHLHQRIVEHKNSAIGKHLVEAHGQLGNPKESQFRILRKCQTKFECLIYEMLFIKEINPSLNTQADSIRAKLFVWTNILNTVETSSFFNFFNMRNILAQSFLSKFGVWVFKGTHLARVLKNDQCIFQLGK